MHTIRECAVALLLTTSACSWATMARPPPTPIEPVPPVACTTSRLAPALDTVGAVFLGVPGAITTGYGIATPVCSGFCLLEPESASAKGTIIAVGLILIGLGTMEAISAATGYSWASDCEGLQETQLACVSGVEASCARLRTPPPREGGKAPGEVCAEDVECRRDDACFRGRCQPRTP
jgi:hypothetical protein